MTNEQKAVASAIKSAADLNRARPDESADGRRDGAVAINALHTAVIGIASRMEAIDPAFERESFVRACGTVEV